MKLLQHKYTMWGLAILGALIGSALTWLLLKGQIALGPEINVFNIFSLRLYSLCVVLAIAVSIWLYDVLRRQVNGLEKLDLIEAALFLLVPGVIGARIYHVFTDYYLYADNPAMIFAIWDGGVGFIGGVIGGAIGLAIYQRVHKFDANKALGILAMVLPIGHAISRFGNFFNRELYGWPTDLPWGMYVAPEFRSIFFINNEYFHPLFLYEALGNLVLAAFLYWKWRNGLKGRHLVAIYLVGYGVIRYSLDFLRIEGRTGIGFLSYAQWLILSAFIFVVLFGIVYQLWHRWKFGVWFTSHAQHDD